MTDRLHALLSQDHQRLRELLDAALRADGSIDEQFFAAFRSGLLRHIGIEERILFADLRGRSAMSEVEVQLHRDHAVLAALLVPPPAAPEIELIRAILSEHDVLEEEAGGMYERVEQLAGEDLEKMLAQLRKFPEIPTAPYSDSPILRKSIAHLLQEAEEGRRRLAATRESRR